MAPLLQWNIDWAALLAAAALLSPFDGAVPLVEFFDMTVVPSLLLDVRVVLLSAFHNSALLLLPFLLALFDTAVVPNAFHSRPVTSLALLGMAVLLLSLHDTAVALSAMLDMIGVLLALLDISCLLSALH